MKVVEEETAAANAAVEITGTMDVAAATAGTIAAVTAGTTAAAAATTGTTAAAAAITGTTAAATAAEEILLSVQGSEKAIVPDMRKDSEMDSIRIRGMAVVQPMQQWLSLWLQTAAVAADRITKAIN